MKTILGRKIGMTQVFDEQGTKLPVTVVDVSDVAVSQLLRSGDKVTHIEVGMGSKRKPIKALAGQYKQANTVPAFKAAFVASKFETIPEVGQVIAADSLVVGDVVRVQGVTKGKGFQGVVKRYHFAGGPKTHGQSDKHRSRGSSGSGTTPGRVFKGLRMAGHMGNVQQTIKNLKVVSVDAAANLICLGGSVPGNKGAYLVISTMR